MRTCSQKVAEMDVHNFAALHSKMDTGILQSLKIVCMGKLCFGNLKENYIAYDFTEGAVDCPFPGIANGNEQ